MDINEVFQTFGYGAASQNNTTASTPQISATILETFIPGYSIISRFFLVTLGFDITFFVSVSFLIFGVGTSLIYSGKYIYNQVEYHCTSYVVIESQDEIFDHLMSWFTGKKIFEKSGKLLARDGTQETWEMNDDDGMALELDPDNLLNFSNWDARVPPKFQPSYNNHYFFHRGNLFRLNRRQKEDNSWWRTPETMTLSCIGGSTQPIKRLLKEARDHCLTKHEASTLVYRPSCKDRDAGYWMRAAERPTRPMHTVILAADQKSLVLADINEYLHPITAKWYSDRGIPYRRGYLFSGPPGTGKSSFAWAIAGIFGLKIYCLSLNDPKLTEDALGRLFNHLPRRCVVLLEDIDTAGLKKRHNLDAKDEPKESAEPKKEESASDMSAEITKAFKSANSSNDEDKGITLSGLLNAIDGVASHEGRVLVMTTNCPDKLDEALIRPGRIDMKVHFTNATRAQAQEIFSKMYSPTVSREPIGEKEGPSSPSPIRAFFRAEDVFKSGCNGDPKTPTYSERAGARSDRLCMPKSPSLLEAIDLMAAQFAERVPEEVFSPAELQGFLLIRKREPARAVAEVEAWKDEELKAREKRKAMKAEEKVSEANETATTDDKKD